MNLREYLGLFRTQKKRFNNFPVFCMNRRIDFERILAHSADFFFGWNGDAQRGIRAIPCRIFCRFTNILMAQNHGHTRSLKCANVNRAFRAGLLKRIVVRVHDVFYFVSKA